MLLLQQAKLRIGQALRRVHRLLAARKYTRQLALQIHQFQHAAEVFASLSILRVEAEGVQIGGDRLVRARMAG